MCPFKGVTSTEKNLVFSLRLESKCATPPIILLSRTPPSRLALLLLPDNSSPRLNQTLNEHCPDAPFARSEVLMNQRPLADFSQRTKTFNRTSSVWTGNFHPNWKGGIFHLLCSTFDRPAERGWSTWRVIQRALTGYFGSAMWLTKNSTHVMHGLKFVNDVEMVSYAASRLRFIYLSVASPLRASLTWHRIY